MGDTEQAAIDALLAAGRPNEARAVEHLRARLNAMLEQYQAGQRFSYDSGRNDERSRCAKVARNGCLVPPDGGSPTEDEAAMCEEIARRILEGV